MEIEFYGISNIDEFLSITNVGYEPENNARFNLPLYNTGFTHAVSGIGHASGGVLVGKRISQDSISNNPLEFEDWYFIGYENGTGAGSPWLPHRPPPWVCMPAP